MQKERKRKREGNEKEREVDEAGYSSVEETGEKHRYF